MQRFFVLLAACLGLAACGPSDGSGTLNLAIIGDQAGLYTQGVRLPPGAQAVRAATEEGLVALDPAGQVVPALAERWIITDDGMSYIFRLRDSDWPGGQPITASEVRNLLREVIARTRGTSLGLDLAKIAEIRTMTERVIEIRLTGPMPDFLRLLAQPELGLVKSGSGAGPMVLARDEEMGVVRLSALPPEVRGQAARENWQALSRPLALRALPVERAVKAFANGEVDLVMGGRIQDFPLARVGPLSRGTIQVDPAIGLLGFAVMNEKGLLADPARRQALSMAIERSALTQPFGLGGWQPSSWIVPPSAFTEAPYPADRWEGMTLAERRAAAARRIAAWKNANDGQAARLRVALPQGPGSDLLLRELARAWGEIGVEVVRVAYSEAPDLELRDTLARYASPRWFLNQFHCSLKAGLCSRESDELVRQSLVQRDSATKERVLAEAHQVLMAAEVFIPLGAPVRWSLVRSTVRGYQANPWGLHPLFPLSQPDS
ncbi:MAG: ABC transporter substrate-binding protein [Erythrobacter sp.]